MEQLTEQEKNDMRDILEKFYGSQVRSWKITIKVFEVLGELIKETSQCSKLIDMVPRPFGGGSVVNWGKKQVRDFVLRKLKSNEGKYYIICMKVGALRFKTKFEMARI